MKKMLLKWLKKNLELWLQIFLFFMYIKKIHGNNVFQRITSKKLKGGNTLCLNKSERLLASPMSER